LALRLLITLVMVCGTHLKFSERSRGSAQVPTL